VKDVDTSGTEAGSVPVETQEARTGDDSETSAPVTSHAEPMDST